MGRLEDVVARHAERKKLTSRKATLILVGIVLGVGILLLIFTDLGMPKAPPAPPPPDPRDTRVDNVMIMTPAQAKAFGAAHAKPATVPAVPSAAAPPAAE